MTPESWHRIEEAFHRALDLPSSERRAFLDELCADDRALHDEVCSLLDSAAQATVVLRRTIEGGAAHVVHEAAMAQLGGHLGPYRLVALIGEGGMGSVYRAVRDDDEYHSQVAVKVLRHGLGTPQAIARFRDERQILAALDHPGIVRLLDGGSTERGVPYLVLEYVEGVPITRYAKQYGLGVRERVELLLPVCAAVQYAHQRLVVHRDIKPSNVLVGEKAAPKLLDFGIAKLLDPGAAADREAWTRTGMALLTPEYASPEQARGEPVSTASDVYSLGALLYELLADRPPLQPGSNPLDALREICEQEPPKASEVCPPDRRAEIAGDLDTIVAKALHKEPAQRYASVSQLADDLRRHLDGQAIAARPATFAYRARKFLRRNRGKVAIAGAVSLALVGLTVWSMREAQRADIEAKRAEHRFAQGRKLATTLLNEIEEQIHALKGATTAREQLVRSAIEYLDGLAADAAADPGLSRELAYGYMKLGDVLGDSYDINLGRSQDALASYQKARLILDRMTDERDDPATLRARAACLIGTGLAQHGLGDAAADPLLREGIAAAEALPADQQLGPEPLLRAYNALAYLEKDIDSAKRVSARGAALAAQWRASEPTSRGARYWSGIYAANDAEWRAASADPRGAADELRQAETIFTALEREYPDDARYTRDRAVAMLTLAGTLHGVGGALIWQPSIGDLDGALAEARAVVPIFEELSARDPQDFRVRVDLGGVIATLAQLESERDLESSLPIFERALDVFAKLPVAWRGEYYTRQMEWFAHCAVSAPLAKVGRREEALEHAKLGLDLATQLGKDERGGAIMEMCSYLVAEAHHVLGDDATAGTLLDAAIERLDRRLAAPAPSISVMIGEVASLQRLAIVRPTDGCTLARRAAAVWRRWKPRSPYIDAHQAELDRAAAAAACK